jgi:archaellum component FlaF (FlaF/FlaG flagellin family)
MQKFTFLILFVTLIYGVYNQFKKEKPSNVTKKIEKTSRIDYKKMIQVYGLDKTTKLYIIDVINNGSKKLHFKKNEIMEGGYIPKKDASKVACYVMSLSGKECDFPKEAVMLFSSSCAGCHGNDGKGLGGVYPDLTQDRLLGLR